MALPVSVPYAFANATTTQNLSYLDSNFNTLSYTLNGIGNGTVSLANVSITGGTISANVSATSIHNGTSNVSVDSANGPVSINTNGSNAMYIDASQNVGIGTNGPAAKLDVSNGYIRINEDGSGTKVIQLRSNWAGVDPAINVQTNNSLLFATNGTERMRIDSSGNLLIGTTSSTVGANTGAKIVAGSDPADRMQLGSSSSTNVGIGYSMYSTGAAAYRFYVGYGGTIYATSTTITAISDQRLKENIQDIDVGLNAIMALKPRKFDWKQGEGKDKKGDRGWIAQEFEQVFPEMVESWEGDVPDGEEPYKAVNADLIPILVAAMQEQQKLIQELSAEVTALKAKVGQ